MSFPLVHAFTSNDRAFISKPREEVRDGVAVVISRAFGLSHALNHPTDRLILDSIGLELLKLLVVLLEVVIVSQFQLLFAYLPRGLILHFGCLLSALTSRFLLNNVGFIILLTCAELISVRGWRR